MHVLAWDLLLYHFAGDEGNGVTQAWGAAQVFVGSKQKELKAGSMALMAGYTPVAAVMLALLVPIFEPLGMSADPPADTLIGYPYTPQVHTCLCVHHTW